MVAALQKQIAAQERRCEEVGRALVGGVQPSRCAVPHQVQERHDELYQRYAAAQGQLEEVGVVWVMAPPLAVGEHLRVCCCSG